MSKPDTPMLYRTIAQTEDGLTIIAETKKAVTLAKAEIDVEEHVLPKRLQSGLKPWVTVPVATKESWENGYVNFCPRCGRRLEDTESETYQGDCFECGASLYVEIQTFGEDNE